jgi:signal transduction histidine kinase
MLEAIADVYDAESATVLACDEPKNGTGVRSSLTERYRWRRPGVATDEPPSDRPSNRGGNDQENADAATSDRAAADPDPRETVIRTVPLGADGTIRGELKIEGGDSDTAPTDAERVLIEVAAQTLDSVLARRGRPVPPSGPPTHGRGANGASAAAPSDRLERRIQTERALVEASRLLLTSDTCDFDRLMEIVGTATGAAYAYLVVITPSAIASGASLSSLGQRDGPFQLDTYRQYEWLGSSEESETAPNGAEDGNEAVFAVPILSSDDQLFGYIGIEYGPNAAASRDEDTRILSVLGDLLCSYLQRQISEEALRRSENRYRHFVDTISEAIWRVDISPPISTDAPVETQIDHLLTNGIMAECNTAAAELAGADAPDAILGKPLGEVAGWMQTLVRDVVQAEYRLRQHEHMDHIDGRKRHFVINTVGVNENGQWTGLWGSTTEVTERVQLERRMVATLERQQRRIGKNLHDRVGQQLAGTRMLAQNLAHRHFPDPEEPGRTMIDRIVRYVQEAIQHVNDLQRGVMPVQVDRDGLAQALAELSSRTGMHEDIQCTYEHDGHTDVEDHEIKLQLYRIAQEATRNAVLHAEPATIEVRLETNGDALLLQVKDDGTGFDDPGNTSTDAAFGLHSMRYRARAIGADLQIDTEPGRGTVVRCQLPVNAL